MSSSEIGPVLAGARLDHVCMVVRDLDRTLEGLTSSGLGPFRHFSFSNNALVYGKPTFYTLKMALGRMNPGVDLEVIQVVEGDNEVHRRFLEKGEGIEHIGFEVEDLEGSIAKLEDAGFPVILMKREGKTGSVYMDTTSVGGVITELIRKGFKPDDPTTWPK